MEDLKLLEKLEQFKAESKQQAIRLTAQRSDRTTATSSKFGGLPYLPKNFVYPTDAQGNPLKLLAQLNFGELPRLADFPMSGILQFFVLFDDIIGLNLDNLAKNDKHKIIYHEKILPENQQMTDFPKIKYVGKYSEEDGFPFFPFEDEFLLTGELIDICIHPSVCDFDDKFLPFCEKHNIKYDVSDAETFDEIQEMLYEILEDEDQHLIGGYPSFCQGDPRNIYGNEKLLKYDTLLLKISSDYSQKKPKDHISWADSGVANFFVNFADLKNLKFDDVLYTWDCC